MVNGKTGELKRPPREEFIPVIRPLRRICCAKWGTPGTKGSVALEALDLMRHSSCYDKDLRLDKAVEFLLEHWVFRKFISSCHYGTGTSTRRYREILENMSRS